MLAIIAAAAISNTSLALIFLVLVYAASYRFISIGTDFYVAMLLGFLMSGVGFLYLGQKHKGSRWFMLQIVAFIAAVFFQSNTNIESKFIGLIIVGPWILQLLVTAITYKDKFGDIDFF